jgi:hypothetical protein
MKTGVDLYLFNVFDSENNKDFVITCPGLYDILAHWFCDSEDSYYRCTYNGILLGVYDSKKKAIILSVNRLEHLRFYGDQITKEKLK